VRSYPPCTQHKIEAFVKKMLPWACQDVSSVDNPIGIEFQ
jgi:hypothetical protein